MTELKIRLPVPQPQSVAVLHPVFRQFCHDMGAEGVFEFCKLSAVDTCIHGFFSPKNKTSAAGASSGSWPVPHSAFSVSTLPEALRQSLTAVLISPMLRVFGELPVFCWRGVCRRGTGGSKSDYQKDRVPYREKAIKLKQYNFQRGRGRHSAP